MLRVPEGCVPPPMRCGAWIRPRYAPISGDINFHVELRLRAGAALVDMEGIVRVTSTGCRVVRMKPESYALFHADWLDEVLHELWPQIVDLVGNDRVRKDIDIDFEPKGYQQGNNRLAYLYRECMLVIHDWANWCG